MTPSINPCCTMSSLQLSLPPCPYSQPCLALHSTGLAAVARGANHVQVYSMGRWLHLGATGDELCGEEGVEKTMTVNFVRRKNSAAGIRDY